VVSFYEHVRAYCSSLDKDVWFVQNGDWIDGTGLAMDGNPSYLVPLIQKMPFDVLNTGNHELYRPQVVDYMTRPGGFIDWWGSRYLASNVYYTDGDDSKAPPQPLGNKYTVLEGKHSTILVFGFLYDMGRPNDKVTVVPAADEVQQKWFHNALTQHSYDAILVMVHAGHDDPTVSAIHTAIRRVVRNDNMPIQFVAGHTHYRRFAVADPVSTIVEAGKYLDTVGFVSFPTLSTVVTHKQQKQRLLQDTRNDTDTTATASPSPDSYSTQVPTTASTGTTTEAAAATTTTTTAVTADLFEHVFLDANIATLQRALGITPNDGNEFQTPYGKEINTFIDEARTKMGLTKKIGCAPHDYVLNVSMARDDSLWRLFVDNVAPHQLLKRRRDDDDSTAQRAMLLPQSTWRYDLYGRNDLTYDDVIAVSPFNDPIFLVGTVPGHFILELNRTMNDDSSVRYYSPLPKWILASSGEGPIDPDQDCELYGISFDVPSIQEALRKLYPDLGEPIEQNVTSTSLWLSFVIEEWHCFGVDVDNQWWSSLDDKVPSATHYTTTTEILIGVMTIAVFIAMFGFVICCYCYCRGVTSQKQYGDMMTAFQDDNRISEEEEEEKVDDLKEDEPPIQIV
jgi:hypothetical protein